MSKGPARSVTALAALAMAALGAPASARLPSLDISPEADLDFGRFAVFGSGYRTVSSSGAVSESGILAVHGYPTRPARFTVAYDRGNESNHPLDLVIEVVLLGAPTVNVNGVTGVLSAFDSDLPEAPRLVPGQIVRLAIRNCRTMLCSRTFHVGARLDVTRSTRGAALSIPLPVTATLVSVIGTPGGK